MNSDQILQVVGAYVLVLDRTGRVLRANEHFRRALGLDPRDLLDKHISSLGFPRDTLVSFQTEFAALVRSEDGTQRSFAWALETAPNKQIPVNWKATLTRAGVVLVGVERPKERSWSSQDFSVGGSIRGAKDSFLANMSHELRTPLSAILGFSELLEQEHFGPLLQRQRLYVENIQKSGRRLLNLVNDVLDLSKIESRRLKLACEIHPVSALVATVVSVLQAEADAASVRLEVDSSEVEVTVYADGLRFRQILYNLVSNALKFTQRGGEVRIRATQTEEGTRVEVSDTGEGISEQDLARIFVAFDQLGSRTGDAVGAGLGLALTRGLVELHGGTISVRSEPGVGSSFAVEFPRAARPTQALSRRPDASRPEVLIVEEDPQTALLISGALQSAGLSFACASSAKEGFESAVARQPGFITINVAMAGGWGLLQRLKGSPETVGIPVTVVSGLEQQDRGRLLGAEGYLVRPIQREELLRTLSQQGARLSRLDGVKVTLLEAEAGAGEVIGGELRRAGCVIGSDLDQEAQAVVVCGSRGDPANEAKLSLQATRGNLPLIVLWSGGRPEGLPAACLSVSRTEAEACPELLVRRLHSVAVRGEQDHFAGLLRAGLRGSVAGFLLGSGSPESHSPLLLSRIRAQIRRGDLVGRLTEERIVVALATEKGETGDLEGRVRELLADSGCAESSILIGEYSRETGSLASLLDSLRSSATYDSVENGHGTSAQGLSAKEAS